LTNLWDKNLVTFLIEATRTVRIIFADYIDFPLGIIPDKALNKVIETELEKINAEARKVFEEGVMKANAEYEQAMKEVEGIGACSESIKPYTDYL
jgi:hypothetical protein